MGLYRALWDPMYVLLYDVLSDDLTLSDYSVLQSYPVRVKVYKEMAPL
jgi:hypothetical protein